MEVLSDETVVVCGNGKLVQYDLKTGETLHEMSTIYDVNGLAEVMLERKPALAVSFPEVLSNKGNVKCKARVDFHDVPYLCKLRHSEQLGFSPGKLCATTGSSQLFVQHGDEMKKFNYSSCLFWPWEEPESCTNLAISFPYQIADVCVTENPNMMYYIKGPESGGSTQFFKTSLDFRSSLEQCYPAARSSEVRFTSITTDGEGSLFLCDTENECIHKFNLEGKNLGTVLKCGELGFGEPQCARWCNKTSSLVVAHYKNEKYEIGVLKL